LRYSWSILFYRTTIFLGLLIGVSVVEYQWYVAVMAGGILLPFLWALMETKSIIVKEPYKF